MKNPLVTVVIPTYNSEMFLAETIQSVIDQSYSNIELYIIDGGSQDRTLDIIKTYQTRVNYWVSEPDKGQSNAINKGFKKAKGEIIGWIGGDDILYSYTIEEVVKIFDNDNQIGVVYGDVDKINKNGEIFINKKSKPLTIDYLINVHATYPQPGSFFRKDFVAKVGYLNESLHQVMDYDLFLKLLRVSKGHYLGIPLAKFRMHSSNKSTVQGGWVGSIEGFKVSREHGGRIFSKLTMTRIKRMVKFAFRKFLNNILYHRTK